jgi:hypothetical protein
MGLPDERRIVVASHAGIGVFDAGTGQRVLRVRDNDYAWWDADRLAILLPTPEGDEVVPCMGLEGGSLPHGTSDGWTYTQVQAGAVVSHNDQRFAVEDPEEFRAAGFSPLGTLFAYATSPNLTVLSRQSPGE